MSVRPTRIFLPPPVIYLLFLGLAFGLEHWCSIPLADNLWTHWVGWVLIDTGVLLMLWAALHMFAQSTTVNPYGSPRSLVVDGPFRFSRNPIYLADSLVYCGIALHLSSVWPWLLLPALVLCMNRCVIRHEEALLTQRFGEQFRTYRTRVRRWI